MSLKPIVAALGGDLYAGGLRANVPAPGHSAADRSVSLLVSDGRLVIHGFGGADWREARDALRRGGFIDARGRLLPAGGAPWPASPGPDRRARVETAEQVWRDARPVAPGTAAARYLARRGVPSLNIPNLGHSTATPVSVYSGAGPRRPALIARISDANDRLTGVEITYLDQSGRRASDLALARKTIGRRPPGAAIRLAAVAPRMLVGEGVFTTLSAMGRFGLPGWALTSAHNLAVWRAPPGVSGILIAADRGEAGEAAARRLAARLRSAGLTAQVRCPPAPWGDWNEAALAAAQGKEK